MGAGRDADVTFEFSGSDAGLGTTLEGLNGGAETLFDTFSKGAVKIFSVSNKFNEQFSKLMKVQAQMVAQSRTFIGLAQRFDVPIEKMGALQKIAFDAGITLGQLVRGLRGLDRNINDALKMPGGAKYNALAKLGFDKDEIERMGADSSYAFRRIRDALREIPDESSRAAAAQEVLGANFSAMIPVIEQSNQALLDAEMAAHNYTAAGMAAASATSKVADDVEQDMKPAAQILTGLFGLLEIGIGLAIRGLSIFARGIRDTLISAFTALYAVGQKFYANVVIPIIKAKNIVAGVASGDFSKIQRENAILDMEGNASSKDADANFEKAGKLIRNPATKKDLHALEVANDRSAMMADAILEGMGFDAYYIKDATERNKAAKEERDKFDAINKTAAAQKMKMITDINQRGGSATPEETEKIRMLMDMEEKASQAQQEQSQIVGETQVRIQRYNDAQGKDKSLTGGKREFTPQQLEAFRREQTATEVKLGTKMSMAELGPQSTETQSAIGVAEAYQEMLNAQEKLSELEKTTNAGEMEVAKLQNAATEAKIKFIEKEKAHLFLKGKIDKEMQVAEFNRAEAVTEEMNRRDLLNKKRGGMVGRDMQVAVVENEAEKLRRMEIQMERILGDKFTSQSERDAAKAGLDKQTSKVMSELDKLGGMQMLFIVSDAAKKGMGGGRLMIDNPVDIAKSTRDYIRMQYELMIANSKIPFDNQTPFQIRGGVLLK